MFIRTGALVDQAKALRAEGLTYQQISEEMGVSVNTAWRWCSGEPTRAEEKLGERALEQACKKYLHKPQDLAGVVRRLQDCGFEEELIMALTRRTPRKLEILLKNYPAKG